MAEVRPLLFSEAHLNDPRFDPSIDRSATMAQLPDNKPWPMPSRDHDILKADILDFLNDYPVTLDSGQICMLGPNLLYTQHVLLEAMVQQFVLEGGVSLILLKPRQFGGSTLVQAVMLWLLSKFPNARSLTVAHSLMSAAHLLGDMGVFAAQRMPFKYNRAFGSDRDRWARDENGRQLRVILTNYKGVNKRDSIWMKLANLSAAKSVVARPGVGQSETFAAGHFSECARWKDALKGNAGLADSVLADLMPAIPTAKVRPFSFVCLESTAEGAQGMFFEKWKEAERGGDRFKAVFIPFYHVPKYCITELPPNDVDASRFEADKAAYDEYRSLIHAGSTDMAAHLADRLRLDEEEVRITTASKDNNDPDDHKIQWGNILWRRREGLSNCGTGQEAVRQFPKNYPATADEAFLGSGHAAFNTKVLISWKEAPDRTPIMWQGDIFLDEHTRAPNLSHRTSNHFRKYANYNPQHVYVIGCDPAAGGAAFDTGGRNCDHAACVFDRNTKRVVAVYQDKGPTPSELGRILYAIGSLYDFPPIIIDREANGINALEALKTLKYPRLFAQVKFDSILKQAVDVPGFHIGPNSRKTILTALRDAIDQQLLVCPDLPTIDQLLKLVITISGHDNEKIDSPSKTIHTDLAFALALAWKAHTDTKLRLIEGPQIAPSNVTHINAPAGCPLITLPDGRTVPMPGWAPQTRRTGFFG